MDLSDTGLGLQTLNPLEPGALVLIRARGSLLIVGKVRYSIKKANYFQSGVQVECAEDCLEKEV